MLGRLLILFLVVPLVELYLLLRFASVTGIPATIGVVILTGVCGSMLAARQGSQAIKNFQTAIAQGRIPSVEVIEGIMIAFAAALLLTPGLLTDFIGLSILVPWSRQRIRRWMVNRYAGRFKVMTFTSGRSTESDVSDWDDRGTVDASFRPTGKPSSDPPLIDRS
jgi:UPF0716 protein FxsA